MGNTDAAIHAFRLMLICLPAAAYLAFLGWVQCRDPPYLMSGRRDLSLLAMMLAPILAVSLDWRIVPDLWPMLAAGAVLVVGLMLLLGPRELSSWVFYNAERPDVENLLGECLTDLGHTLRRSGDTFETADGSLVLTFSESPLFRNVTVYYRARGELDAARLEHRLMHKVGKTPSASGQAGIPLLMISLALLVLPTIVVVRNYTGIALLLRRAFAPE